LLETWVSQAKYADLEAFVSAVTGASGLSPTARINIELKAPGLRFPTFHTCANLIRLHQADSYRTFKADLEFAIRESLQHGFSLV
jgi:hypothetical protein